MSLDTARRVLRIEAEALTELLRRLDESFERAVELLLACKGRVVVVGMGKSGLIGRKIAATFSSTGTPSVFLHPAEAVHGDLGMLMRDDLVLAVSYGGETEEIAALLETITRLGLRMISLTGHPKSTIAAASDVTLDVSVKEEACSLNLAPTASTTAAMAMGDALAVSLLDRRGFSSGDFAALHPGGRLGKKLLRVENLMHSGEALPRVPITAKMPDVIYEISKKGLGMTTVVDSTGRLAGILTDGDLRRLMQQRGAATIDLVVGDCMNKTPQTLAPSELAGSALRIMEERKITSLVVVDAGRKPLGVVHLHDLWTLELFYRFITAVRTKLFHNSMPKKISKTKSATNLAARAKKIRVLLMDVDGVLTDGRIWLLSRRDGTASEIKGFSAYDGAGLKLARAAGLRTGLITGRESTAVAQRARECEIEFVYQHRATKMGALEEILQLTGADTSEVAYVGDDLPDLAVLERVGLAVAVANAAPEVKRAAHFVTSHSGGEGAVREVIELIVKAQGKWAAASRDAKA